MDLTWETAFEKSDDTAAELLAEIRMECHREDIPPNARPILNKLLRMRKSLDEAQAKAFAAENDSTGTQAQEISSVSLQSTSVSYVSNAQSPYGNKAKASKALEKLQEDYDNLHTKLVHNIRKFPRPSNVTNRDVITFC